MPLTNSDVQQLRWRKARRSMNNGDCVEVAAAKGRVFVRDSKNPDDGALESSSSMWRSFISNAKHGVFDIDGVMLLLTLLLPGRPLYRNVNLIGILVSLDGLFSCVDVLWSAFSRQTSWPMLADTIDLP